MPAPSAEPRDLGLLHNVFHETALPYCHGYAAKKTPHVCEKATSHIIMPLQ